MRELERKAVSFYSEARRQVITKAAESRARLLALLVPDSENGWVALELEPTQLFKVVASMNGELLSTFDGETKYQIGKWTRSKSGAASWPPLDCCFYGYPSAEKALSATFPKGSKLLEAPKVLMQFETCGKAYLHPGRGMLAVPAVRPLRLLPGTVAPPVPTSPLLPAPEQPADVGRRTPPEGDRRNPWVPV
ncbi:hypothetical protein HYH03_016726 [Edaphochlamys debaryana]|uniref:Uncharacterized protein n=1 Tax=Edaphochlamys debaryana TaxID=47281 RepID=A0A836BQ00_9CHLO|nr:hypothetical protein HYH03_016726 [Edaphochlamys debaryana]|eukprot:KAG2484497.1 hypothetical protein HYH03_016726 [Edaphochlamys debaryana]